VDALVLFTNYRSSRQQAARLVSLVDK